MIPDLPPRPPTPPQAPIQNTCDKTNSSWDYPMTPDSVEQSQPQPERSEHIFSKVSESVEQLFSSTTPERRTKQHKALSADWRVIKTPPTPPPSTNNKTPTVDQNSKQEKQPLDPETDENVEISRECASGAASVASACNSIQVPAECGVGVFALTGAILSVTNIRQETHKQQDIEADSEKKAHQADRNWKDSITKANLIGQQLYDYIESDHTLDPLKDLTTLTDSETNETIRTKIQQLERLKTACVQHEDLIKLISDFTQTLQEGLEQHDCLEQINKEKDRQLDHCTNNINQQGVMTTGYTTEIGAVSCSLAHLIAVATPLAIVSGGILVSGRIGQAIIAEKDRDTIEKQLDKTTKLLDQHIPALQQFLEAHKIFLTIELNRQETTRNTASASASGTGVATVGSGLLFGGVTAPIGIGLMITGVVTICTASITKFVQERTYAHVQQEVEWPNLDILAQDLKDDPSLIPIFSTYLGVSESVLRSTLDNLNELLSTPETGPIGATQSGKNRHQRSSDG